MGLAIAGLLVFGIVILSAVTRNGRRRVASPTAVPADTVAQVDQILRGGQPTGLTTPEGRPIVTDGPPRPPETELNGGGVTQSPPRTTGPATPQTDPVDLSEQHGGAIITPPQALPQRRVSTTDIRKAKNMAPQVSSNLRTGGRGGYDRNLLRTFQRYAGLGADGIYGPRTHGALVYFRQSPPPAFSGRGTVRYRPAT